MNSLVVKDFEKSLEYVLPEFFDIIPRDQMMLAMEQTFNNPSVKIELKDGRILEIQDEQKIDGRYFSLISYSNQMFMKYMSDEDESEEAKEDRIKLTSGTFEQLFGQENVKYNAETEFFEIHVVQQAFAISRNGKSEWKFLVTDKKQMVVLEKLLPAVLLEKL